MKVNKKKDSNLPTTRNPLKKTSSKKQKLEEDIAAGAPIKLAKTNAGKISGRREPVEKPVGLKLPNPRKQTKTDKSEIKGGKKRKRTE